MAELNLALKKDVFEGLLNGTSNEIPIKKNDWWTKRLMDPDTGRFKWFDLVMASCGSSEKYPFEIDHIEDKDEYYVIYVVLEKQEEPEPEPEPEQMPEPSEDDMARIQEMINQKALEELQEEETDEDPDVEYDDDEGEQIGEEINPVKVNPEIINPKPANEYMGIKARVVRLIGAVCQMKDVYVVNMPLVTIRNNGNIIGCLKNFTFNFDRDVRFAFVKKEFVLYPERGEDVFFELIKDYLSLLRKSNYLFINKNACVFGRTENGLLTFTVTAVGKRKYLFNGR
jgi:hypothetical protein